MGLSPAIRRVPTKEQQQRVARERAARVQEEAKSILARLPCAQCQHCTGDPWRFTEGVWVVPCAVERVGNGKREPGNAFVTMIRPDCRRMVQRLSIGLESAN